MKKSIIQVALLVDVLQGCGRGISLGVSNYVASKGNWVVFPHEHPLPKELPEWMARTRVDAVIAYRAGQNMLRKLNSLGIPSVDVHGRFQDTHIPVIRTDASALVHMGLRFLSECGFRHLAFCGFKGVFFSEQREEAFRRQAPDFLASPHCFQGSGETVLEYDVYRQKQYSPDGGKELAGWLLSLPKPIGILACNDIRALQLINACRKAALHIPDQVAVLGVDNDEVLCSLSRPTLSSIEQDTDRLGSLAASLIDRMLKGEKVPLYHEVPPKGIVERTSTDVVVSENPIVVRASRMIRNQVALGLSVKEICSALSVSRSALDEHFRESLGRTVSDVVHSIRLKLSRSLLLSTELSVDEIAERAGFSSATHLGRFFKRETGMSPSEFRACGGRMPSRKKGTRA